MTTLRQAAQQALEALKSCSAVPHWPALQPTITALRDALAQPEQEAVADVEYYGLDPWEVSQFVPFATAIYPTHSPTKPFLAFGDCAHLYQDAIRCVPLYTHPPRREWQSLTDEEIDDLSRTMVKGNKSVNWLTLAILAALKEKNT